MDILIFQHRGLDACTLLFCTFIFLKFEWSRRATLNLVSWYQSIIELYWKFLIDESYSGVSMLNFESKVNKKNI